MIKKYLLKLKKIVLFADKHSGKPKCYPIQLTEPEQNKLISILKTTRNYLEFGSGGSTFLALIHSKASITSVESDKNWIIFLKNWKIVKTNINKRLYFYNIDIGPTKEWGYPANPELYKDKFPNYSNYIFDNILNDFDTVFVDGRFRVACILQTILHCKNNTKILVHDFFDRSFYHPVLKFLEITDSVDNLAILKIKENINLQEVIDMYKTYQYIYQ